MKSPHSVQAGFVWLPVLLIILGILTVSGGVYWYWHSTPQPAQMESQQQEVQSQATTIRIDSISPSNSAADGSLITLRGVGFNSGLPDSNDIVIFKNSSREVSSPPESVSPDGTTITLKLSTGIAEGSYQVSVGVARAAQDRPGSVMVKSNSVSFTVTGSQTWKTFKSSLGFQFKYPPEYPVPTDYGAQVFTIISQKDKQTSINFQRESVNGNFCMAGLCNVSAQSKITANNIVWDFVGEAHYAVEGDNQPTPPPNKVYRTVHGNCRYYVKFITEERIQEILSTFSFLVDDSTCPDIKG